MESCGDLFWEDLLEKHEDVSDFELGSCAHVLVVLDVLVSPSSVVIECCDVRFFRVALIGKMLYLLSFSLSPKSEHIVVPARKKR